MATTDAALSLQDATAGLFGQQQHHSGGRADSDGPTVNVTLPTSLRIFQVSQLSLGSIFHTVGLAMTDAALRPAAAAMILRADGPTQTSRQ